MSLAADEPRILAFGDSLTAGYGLASGESFAHRLEQALREQGVMVTVINGGVSGDTTSGGLSRLPWILNSVGKKPDLVILELGANDALRGVSPEITRENLDRMLTLLEERQFNTLLTGMLAPPNMGRDYQTEFNRIYPALAEQHDVLLYPFFLEGVAGNTPLNQADGIHPNARGVDIIVKNITPYVIEALQQPRK